MANRPRSAARGTGIQRASRHNEDRQLYSFPSTISLGFADVLSSERRSSDIVRSVCQ